MKVAKHLINRIRYRWWQLNCSRWEWFERSWNALVEEGYADRATDADTAMYLYWYEKVRS